MMNVQYMIIVLQVNVGWSVVLCVIQLVLFEEGISSLLRVISRVGNHSLSQKKKCSIDILSLSLSLSSFLTFNKQSKTFGGRF